jgi:hypothetical protein
MKPKPADICLPPKLCYNHFRANGSKILQKPSAKIAGKTKINAKNSENCLTLDFIFFIYYHSIKLYPILTLTSAFAEASADKPSPG